MRCFHRTRLAILGWVLGHSGVAPASDHGDVKWLAYGPPSECPGESAIASKVAHWLGRDGVPADLSVAAQISWFEGAWEVSVEVRQREEAGERKVQVSTCADAADFIALTVALAVDPSLVSEGQTPTADDPDVEAADVAPRESADESEQADPSSQEKSLPSYDASDSIVEPRRASSQELALSLRAGGVVQTGNLPGVQAGFGVGTGITFGHAQLEVEGSAFPGRRYKFPEAAHELRFSQLGAGLRGCAVLGSQSLSLLPCVHVEYVWVQVENLGGGATGKGLFLGGIGLFGRAKVAGMFWPYWGGRWALPVDRTAFQVETGATLHRFSYSLQAEVGLQLLWGAQ